MQPAFEISSRAIEPHWRVVGRDGADLGEVCAVVGDSDEDIFDGLAVTRRGGPAALHALVRRPRCVGYELVTASIGDSSATVSETLTPPLSTYHHKIWPGRKRVTHRHRQAARR